MGNEQSNVPLLSDFVAGFWRLKHWGMSSTALIGFIEELISLGVTTVDHAMVYGSEEPFGEALRGQPSLREQLSIVTKFGIKPVGFGELGAHAVNHYDSSPIAIRQSLEASLAKLNTDYVDLLLVHRPDFLMDVEAMAQTFSELLSEGKVRYFGVSNFSKDQFRLLHEACGGSLQTNQVEFSPYAMQALDSGVFEQCQMYGIRPMLWSCLGAGQVLSPSDDKGSRLLQALKVVADEVGASAVEQVVYAWVRMLPCRPVAMLGSSKMERIRLAVASQSLRLTHEQWYRIWEASNGSPVP